MTDLTIDGTSLSSLGFRIKRIDGHKAIGEPKQQGSGSEEMTSVNYYLKRYRQKSPEIEVELHAGFQSIQAAEVALYTLYGILVQIDERAFIHTDNVNSIAFKGIMHKGTNVSYKLYGNGIVFVVKFKVLKTDD